MHIGQFISNTVALGHEVWVWPGNDHPEAQQMPLNRLDRVKTLRKMDAIYIRIEWAPPKVLRWGIAPYRQLFKSPIIIWEFNTVPEQGLTLGYSEDTIKRAIEGFRKYSHGCDLAICVSANLANYVRTKLGIRRTLMIPNASDPDLFHPNAQPVKRMRPYRHNFNVVWIGSAHLSWHNFNLLQETANLIWKSEYKNQIVFHIIGHASTGLMRCMPPNVYYWGAEEYRKLPNWLSAMDVGLCNYLPGPSDFGSPLKVFDYMSSGLAVVGTHQPQLQEILTEMGQSNLLVHPKKPKELAGVLIELAKNREWTRKLGQAGRQRVIEFYNWQRAAKDTVNEIEAILRERKS